MPPVDESVCVCVCVFLPKRKCLGTPLPPILSQRSPCSSYCLHHFAFKEPPKGPRSFPRIMVLNHLPRTTKGISTPFLHSSLLTSDTQKKLNTATSTALLTFLATHIFAAVSDDGCTFLTSVGKKTAMSMHAFEANSTGKFGFTSKYHPK